VISRWYHQIGAEVVIRTATLGHYRSGVVVRVRTDKRTATVLLDSDSDATSHSDTAETVTVPWLWCHVIHQRDRAELWHAVRELPVCSDDAPDTLTQALVTALTRADKCQQIIRTYAPNNEDSSTTKST
jgi:hypothetical protein